MLQGMSADEFSRHKASLASNKLQTDMSLGQEGDRAWEQVGTTRGLAYRHTLHQAQGVLISTWVGRTCGSCQNSDVERADLCQLPELFTAACSREYTTKLSVRLAYATHHVLE